MISRRDLLGASLRGVAMLGAALCFGDRAFAQGYPTRVIRWIVPYPPGGATDITARIVASFMSEDLGQQVIIENRPGAGNNLGTEAVINAAPDGYTLLLVNPANAINATLYRKLPFNFLRDTVQVAGIIRVPNVMEVHPSVPAKTVAEFIAHAKANPGKINWATSGNGTSVHLSGELFKMMTGVELLHVPYRGSAPALTDLLAGQVHVMFDNMPPSLPHIKAGKLRALGVTTAQRSPALPEVPTVAETVPGYEASAFFGVAVPKGTPAATVERLNRSVNAALKNPKIAVRLAEIGGVQIAGTPADFTKLVEGETAKWEKVIKVGKVTLE
ncbi:MAG: tripartite tricarboxylate transporter substrate binding protein [Hyphomicrobiales bacterium]|nr:tripartite tricarboxylate transporter substrate binding protein [Hyphomicrobiales bacterium]